MGLAFQLRDDYLDAFGDQDKVGKQVGGDILANKKTFLLIRLMEKADGEDLELLNNMLQRGTGDEKVRVVSELMRKYKVDEELLDLSASYHEKALLHLEAVHCNEVIRRELEDFAMQIMQREH